MAVGVLERLIVAIGYPERVTEGVLSFILQVDGGEIIASDSGGVLRLVCRLPSDASDLPHLAEYAVGRILREDAVLACDKDGAFLWQELQDDVDAYILRRGFESFADSCDWWRERLESSDGETTVTSPLPEMMIRP